MNVELLLTKRYLQSQSGRFLCSTEAILSILGIAIGVATLTVVMSVMNGFSTKLLNSILGMNGHITVRCNGVEDYFQVISTVKSIPGVVSAVPVVEGQAVVRSEYGVLGTVVRGMVTHDVTDKLLGHIVRGNTETLEEGIIIGAKLAESLGVDYGDEVVLVSPESVFTILGSVPRMKKYKVTGIFDVGMYEYDSAFVYIPLADAQLLFGYEGEVQYVEVLLNDATQSSVIMPLIAEQTELIVEDWKVQQGHYFRALKLEKDAVFFVLVLMVIVAAFNIIAGVSVLARDKKKAIAVMRTMGLSKYAIMRIFCMCGAFIGIIGTGLGSFIGVVFCMNVEKINDVIQILGGGALLESVAYCLDGISPEMIVEDMVKIVLLSLSISLIAAVVPATKAARQNPVDILKYE